MDLVAGPPPRGPPGQGLRRQLDRRHVEGLPALRVLTAEQRLADRSTLGALDDAGTGPREDRTGHVEDDCRPRLDPRVPDGDEGEGVDDGCGEDRGRR